MTWKQINRLGRVTVVVAALGVLAIGVLWRLGEVLAWGGVTAGGITAVQPGNWLNPTAPDPTGAWTGPPEFVTPENNPLYVGERHGGRVYYWYIKGLKGVTPASPNTLVLVTDDWRWRSNYRRADDTIELSATDGRRFRRMGTPEYGVVAVFSPDVDTQALNPVTSFSGSIQLPDGSVKTLDVSEPSFIAQRVTITNSSGTEVEVAGVPKYPTSTIGRRWGGGVGSNASVIAETVIADTAFEIAVRGYADDLSGRGVFVYPATPPTPDTNIKVLGGVASLRDLTVSFGFTSGVTTNGYYFLTAPAGPGIEIPVPPEDPEPVALRYAILYVPGDTVYLPEEVDDGSGGK
jgi:hypothetical protein